MTQSNTYFQKPLAALDTPVFFQKLGKKHSSKATPGLLRMLNGELLTWAEGANFDQHRYSIILLLIEMVPIVYLRILIIL